MGGCVELSSPAFFGEILVGKQITATQLLMPHSYDLLLGTNAKTTGKLHCIGSCR